MALLSPPPPRPTPAGLRPASISAGRRPVTPAETGILALPFSEHRGETTNAACPIPNKKGLRSFSKSGYPPPKNTCVLCVETGMAAPLSPRQAVDCRKIGW